MDIDDKTLLEAEARMQKLRQNGYAVTARYDRRASKVIIKMHTGVQMAIPVRLIEGLADASPADLEHVEISPSGLGLYWPAIDVDIYIPSLMQGIFGTKDWMAKHLGALGGSVRSAAKSAAARENGRKGGRPRKVVNQ